MIAIPVTLGLVQLFDIRAAGHGVVFACSTLGVLVILQAAGFYDLYRRGLVALLVTIASVAAILLSAQAKGEWTLLVAAAGFVGAVAGMALLAQVVLAYAGFIRRQ